jgi:PAS domain S-box-containing protein
MRRLKRWTDLSLHTKGLIVVAVPAAATVMIAGASYVLGAREASEQDAIEHYARTTEQVRQLIASETEASADMRAYFITKDETFANKMRNAFAVFDTARQSLAELAAGETSQRRYLGQLAVLQRSRIEWIFVTTEQFRSGRMSWDELRSAISVCEAERLRMESVLHSMLGEEERLRGVHLRRAAILRAELSSTTVGCVFFGVVGGMAISLLFASGITKRIGSLQRYVVQLAGGGALTPLPGGGDEIGALSDGMSRAAGILRRRREILENALHGIALASAAGGYVSFNKAYAALAGMGEGNPPATIAATVHPEDRPNVEAAIGLMRANGRAETEARIVHPDGRVVDAEMTFLPLSEAGGEYYVFLRDVSLRRETEAALVRARDAALASNRARTEFLAKISHDIRTPLNAILGAADLLSETPLNADQSQYLGMFQRNCRGLVALINDFLDFSRIEAGAVSPQKTPFRIRETVDDAASTFRESASRKGVELTVRIEAGIPEWVLGEPLRIQQVLVNLLSNAVKFTAAGRVSVAVGKTRLPSGEAVLRFEISDTGSGIDAADQNRIFAPFAQLPQQPSGARGSGLGLAICRELVERMGGDVGVASRMGSGSTFYFRIPFEAGQPAVARTEGDSVTCVDRWLRGAAVRILAVEDTEDNRLLLACYLKGEPVEMVFAASGLEAVDVIRGGQEFDLILMDIDLPGLDGYATTGLIREWQAGRGVTPTPIVALSAHAMREAVRASLDAGCVAHVAKPVDRVTLLRTIHAYALPERIDPASLAGAASLAEGIAELVPHYLASKPKQIEEARVCLAAGDFDTIRRFGHNLRGTGSGYGFPCMTRLGKEIENAAAQGDETRIAAQLEALNRMLISHTAAASCPTQVCPTRS